MAAATKDWLVGEAAPCLRLPDTATGEVLDLASLGGRPILVSFLSHAA